MVYTYYSQASGQTNKTANRLYAGQRVARAYSWLRPPLEKVKSMLYDSQM